MPINAILSHGHWRPCFATVDKHFRFRTMRPREEAEEYFKYLAEREKFEYSFRGQGEDGTNYEPNTKANVFDIEFTRYDKPYVILMGNLIKGVEEHKAFASDLLKDLKNDAFFDASLVAFMDVIENKPTLYNQLLPYGESHFWYSAKKEFDFVLDKYHSYPSFTNKVKTIPELFETYHKLKDMYRRGTVWRSTLTKEHVV